MERWILAPFATFSTACTATNPTIPFNHPTKPIQPSFTRSSIQLFALVIVNYRICICDNHQTSLNKCLWMKSKDKLRLKNLTRKNFHCWEFRYLNDLFWNHTIYIYSKNTPPRVNNWFLGMIWRSKSPLMNWTFVLSILVIKWLFSYMQYFQNFHVK